MSTVKFKQECMEGELSYGSETIHVKGKINDNVNKGIIDYLACCPPEKRMNADASGMPYANAEIAFCNSPNKGRIELALGNKFSITLDNPGSYYVGLGTVLIPPTLFIRFKSIDKIKIVSIKINEPVPYRTLTYPIKDLKTNEEQKENILVRSNEQIFKDSIYPMQQSVKNSSVPVPHDSHW